MEHSQMSNEEGNISNNENLTKLTSANNRFKQNSQSPKKTHLNSINFEKVTVKLNLRIKKI